LAETCDWTWSLDGSRATERDTLAETMRLNERETKQRRFFTQKKLF
jgi:hypothetical protein